MKKDETQGWEANKISPRQSIGPKIGVMMKQPTFDWGTEDKYSELKTSNKR